ncbi:MAG: helix-turn-helix domain-containing protein [Rhodobacteraceae bacterium]|nr:helix-turn-helix domain-containing protein [Paracoccaceae bacterium]
MLSGGQNSALNGQSPGSYAAEGLEGLSDRRSTGPAPRLSPDQKAELARMVREGPDPAVDGVVRWRRVDLKRRIEGHFGVTMHERTGNRGKPLERNGNLDATVIAASEVKGPADRGARTTPGREARRCRRFAMRTAERKAGALHRAIGPARASPCSIRRSPRQACSGR